MTLDTALPPTLFDLEPARREIVFDPHGGPFTPVDDRLCGMCRKPMRNLPHTHLCGEGTRQGTYILCDPCACEDLLPDGRPRWGLTPRSLEIDAIRRRVYAAGGGETDVATEMNTAGLANSCHTTWTQHHDRVGHNTHVCLFTTTGPHSRHECHCGLQNLQEDA